MHFSTIVCQCERAFEQGHASHIQINMWRMWPMNLQYVLNACCPKGVTVGGYGFPDNMLFQSPPWHQQLSLGKARISGGLEHVFQSKKHFLFSCKLKILSKVQELKLTVLQSENYSTYLLLQSDTRDLDILLCDKWQMVPPFFINF